MADDMNLTAIMREISQNADEEHLSVGEIVDAFKKRGYGPLLMIAGLFAALPTGAIPGMPIVIAAIVILISVQILIGRNTPWIPSRLRQLKIKRRKYEAARSKAEPYTKKIDRLLKPRLGFFLTAVFVKLIALLCVFLALSMTVLGLIPFAMMAPALAIMFIGLGLAVRDGLVVLLGFTAATASLFILLTRFVF